MLTKKRKDEMSKTERVTAAFKNRETDRTPVYDLMLNDEAVKYFAGEYPDYDEHGVRLKCEAVGKMLDMTRGAAAGPIVPGRYGASNGYVELPGVYTLTERYISYGFCEKPFNNEGSAIEWLNAVNKAMRERISSFDAAEYAEKYCERFLQIQSYIGDDTVQLARESLTGIDYIRAPLGMELFSYIWEDEPTVLAEHFDLCMALELTMIHAIADKSLSPCALTAGDIAMKNTLMHSPQWLREQFFPRLKRLNDAWHEHGVLCLFHSDGDITSVMDDLIATGIDGVNPIETTAGMDISWLKKHYGDKIFLTGGIDMSTLLSLGTADEVRLVCENAVKAAPTGYFMGSTTELDNSSKLENILVMLDVAWNG